MFQTSATRAGAFFAGRTGRSAAVANILGSRACQVAPGSTTTTLPLFTQVRCGASSAAAAESDDSSARSMAVFAIRSAATTISAMDNRDAAAKIWGSLHATPNHLSNAVTGSAGTARITHNLNHGNCRWQASCVEVRPKVKEDDPNENPVIAQRKKQFGQLMPWEKKAQDNVTKFPKSHKFPEDDNVEIVFYFETHDSDGVGLKGYQSIAARVSDGELPGECANITAVGGFATWTVPRSEFVAMTESKPLLGDMLSDAPIRRAPSHGHANESDRHAEEEDLRRVTIRMSSLSDRAKAVSLAEAQNV